MPDGYRVSFLANFFTIPVYTEIERQAGLTRSEYLILFCLGVGGEMTAQDVADVSRRPKNSISRAVHRLLRAGHIARARDEADRRRAVLSLTATGYQLYERFLPLFRERQQALMSALSADERAQLRSLLIKMVAALGDQS